MNPILSTAIATLSLVGIPAVGMLYHTGFEGHDFTENEALTGQDGWTALASPDAAIVVECHAAKSGRRAVECWGGDLEDVGGGLVDGAWERLVSWAPTEKHDVVRVEADIRLEGPDTGSGPGNDLASANLYARNGTGRSAFFFLSSNGNAYAFANRKGPSGTIHEEYKFETPIKFGEYNNLAITLDYETHTAAFEVNKRTIGSLPFGGDDELWGGVLLEVAVYYPLANPKDYTAYYDNVEVHAK